MPKLNVFKKFSDSEDGTIAILFAAFAMLFVLCGGMAIDIARRNISHEDAQAALDSATLLAAIKITAGEDTDTSFALAEQQFFAECRNDLCTGGKKPVFKLNGKEISASFAAPLDTMLMRVVGQDTMAVSVASTVTISPSFHTFYFVIDVSASLGYAADQANVDAMMALTKPYYSSDPYWGSMMPNGCGFACHATVGIEPLKANGTRYTSYELATENGIEFREDVMMNAVTVAAETILEDINGVHADQIKVGAYAFSEDWEQLTKPTANSTNLLKQIDKVSIERGGTHYADTLPDILADIGKAGKGNKESDPKKTVILVTDGMSDYYDAGIYTSAIDTAMCDDYKADGMRLVVINIAYPELTSDNFWNTYAKKAHQDIQAQLKACASAGYYYEADDKPQIQATLNKMAKQLIRTELAVTK